MANTTDGAIQTVGWVNSPDGRGTIDILWSCFVTASLCAWTVLCVSVPAEGEPGWKLIIRKMWLASVCILGPEYMLTMALGQWQSARQSRKAFHDIGYKQWTLRHAFFADMGGFRLRAADPIEWPVNARQLHYLIKEGYIDQETVSKQVMVSKKVIDDKNKQDTVVRVLTLVQTLWFLANCIARAAQGLAITTIELTVCGLVLGTVAVIFFWREKPADISSSILLEIQTTTVEIRNKAGGAALLDWHRTPLDFLDEPQHWIPLHWNYYMSIIRRLRLMPAKHDYLAKIPDDDFKSVHGFRIQLCATILSLACLAVNISAWNYYFPTDVERDLWRVSSLLIFVMIVAGVVYEGVIVPVIPSRERMKSWLVFMKCYRKKSERTTPSLLEKFGNKIKNNTVDNDPWFDVRFRTIVPGTAIAFLYCIARAYTLIEDIIGLRSMPSSAYASVDWTRFIPHI